MEQQNRGSLNSSEQGGNHDDRNGVPVDTQAEKLRYYKDYLEQVLDLVRHNDQADLDRMVSVIRSGASDKEILAVLAELQGEVNHTGQDGHAGNP
ncbi:uncharacterized protein LDX57_012443 [Aspergillus melleus]|uniref:uncharacterized protein n=1 Tax=Aspergillus melleus TaxID=138277 RepID=UPI001E8EAFA9|nr:uncharacterized protein LDX57_012443 [Aspergillus melleus]KAH8434810.1 hypothetical protein LDX57_012443 [Aspergillus melleus]